MAEPIYEYDVPAYAHGGALAKPIPFIVIHSTEGPMSDGNARALAAWFARSPANGGPGTSATDIFDPIDSVQMLPWNIIPYHVGPKGNPKGTGSEHCGSVKLTKAQWLTDRAKSMLDKSARAKAAEARSRGWTLAQCRWLTVSEVARFVAGFCTHNDIRLALGGTTHSDPGPNFPYTWYMERVRFWFVNPNGVQEEDLTIMDDATKKYLDTKFAQQHQDIVTLIYGDNRIDVNPDGTPKRETHPINLGAVMDKLDALQKDVDELKASPA